MLDTPAVRIIREWFSDAQNLDAPPPGLANREELPPGLQRQIQQIGVLPPGLERPVQDLPLDLFGRLPELPPNRRLVIIGSNVILLDETRSRILDLVESIF